MPVSEPFDVGLHLPDLSTAGALLAEIVLARPVDFPAAFVGSTGYARIAATGETVLDVQKNGSNIGTVTFAAASTTPTFALPSATSFAAGIASASSTKIPPMPRLPGSRSPSPARAGAES